MQRSDGDEEGTKEERLVQSPPQQTMNAIDLCVMAIDHLGGTGASVVELFSLCVTRSFIIRHIA